MREKRRDKRLRTEQRKREDMVCPKAVYVCAVLLLTYFSGLIVWMVDFDLLGLARWWSGYAKAVCVVISGCIPLAVMVASSWFLVKGHGHLAAYKPWVDLWFYVFGIVALVVAFYHGGVTDEFWSVALSNGFFSILYTVLLAKLAMLVCVLLNREDEEALQKKKNI